MRVGTVDKFQGQEADVVVYSLASSSGEDVPRGLEFLLSRNRLNVAISRARCLAYLVCSPRLLEVNARSIPQMRLANALAVRRIGTQLSNSSQVFCFALRWELRDCGSARAGLDVLGRVPLTFVAFRSTSAMSARRDARRGG